MARNALLIWFSVVLCTALSAFAQDDSSQGDSRKHAQLVRMLELKRSDAVAVLEPEPFVAPRIADRVRLVFNVNDPAAPAHAIDVIVLYDALHQMEHRAEFYPKLRRLLRPGGRIVNIDLASGVPFSQSVQEFTAAGFQIIKTVSFLSLQYFQVFQ